MTYHKGSTPGLQLCHLLILVLFLKLRSLLYKLLLLVGDKLFEVAHEIFLALGNGSRRSSLSSSSSSSSSIRILGLNKDGSQSERPTLSPERQRLTGRTGALLSEAAGKTEEAAPLTLPKSGCACTIGAGGV